MARINLINTADYLGKRFGNWTVIGTPPYVYGRKKTLTVKCDCGKEAVRFAFDIIYGKSTRCVSCRVKSLNLQKHLPRLSGSDNCNWKGYKNVPHTYFSQIKSGAKKRYIKFEVSIKDIQELWEAQNGLCAYTNAPITFGKKAKIKASLDRIDPKLGYIKGNIQWVTSDINFMKQDFSDEEFLGYIELIYLTKILK